MADLIDERTPERKRLDAWSADNPRDERAMVALAAWLNTTPDKLPKEMRLHTCAATKEAWARVADAIAALPAQGVRPLDRAQGQDKHAGWTLPIELLCAIRDEMRPSEYGGAVCLEEVEMISLAVERRILAALAPAEAGGVERDDPACTDCGCTGVTYQTERRCACQPHAPVNALVKAAEKVVTSYWQETDGTISGIYDLERPRRHQGRESMTTPELFRVEVTVDKPTSGMWHCGPNPSWVTVTHIPTMTQARAYHRSQHKAREAAMACVQMMLADLLCENDQCSFPEALDAPLSPAVLAELPEVRDLMRRAYSAGWDAYHAQQQADWTDTRGVEQTRDADLDAIAAAIREGRG